MGLHQIKYPSRVVSYTTHIVYFHLSELEFHMDTRTAKINTLRTFTWKSPYQHLRQSGPHLNSSTYHPPYLDPTGDPISFAFCNIICWLCLLSPCNVDISIWCTDHSRKNSGDNGRSASTASTHFWQQQMMLCYRWNHMRSSSRSISRSISHTGHNRNIPVCPQSSDRISLLRKLTSQTLIPQFPQGSAFAASHFKFQTRTSISSSYLEFLPSFLQLESSGRRAYNLLKF